MTTAADPSTRSCLGDIASSPQLPELSRLLDALRPSLGPSLRDLPGEEHGPAARQLRRRTRLVATGELRVSVHHALQLLKTRPPVEAQGWAASRPAWA